MSIFEQYSMTIPIFAPSLDFLIHNQIHNYIVANKDHANYKRTLGVQMHPAYNGTARVLAFDPKIASPTYIFLHPIDNEEVRAVRHWLSLADYFTLPHIVHFDSAEQLVEILQSLWEQPTRLLAISAEMRTTNRSRLRALLQYWRNRLLNIAASSPNHPE